MTPRTCPTFDTETERALVALFAPPAFDNPRLSPEGTLLAWLAPDERGIAQICVGAVGDIGGTRRQITNVERPLRFHAWAPDGQGLLYVEDPAGDERWRLTLVGLDGHAGVIGPPDRSADLLARSWHLDDHVLLTIEGETGLADVHRLDLRTRKSELVDRNPGTVDGWFVDARHHVRVATAATSDGGFDLLHRPDKGQPWHNVLHVDADDALTTVVVSVMSRHEILLVTSVASDCNRLAVLDVSAATLHPVAANPEVDVAGVLVHPRSGRPQAVSWNPGRVQWQPLDADVAADLGALDRYPDTDLRIVDRDRRDRRWLVAHAAPDRPTVFSLWHRAEGRLTPLVEDRPHVRRRRLAPVTPVSFLARDGLRVDGYWTAPASQEPPHPTVLMIHGGPWWRDQWEFDPWVQWLAHLGLGCLQVNFRGSAGRGKAFLNAGKRAWGAAMQDDLFDALDQSVERGLADVERLFVLGSSYGGYAALMALAERPGAFRAGAVFAAPTDLVSFLDAIPGDHPTMRHLWWARVGDPDHPDDARRLRNASPLSRVSSIASPLLVVHGRNDARVRIEQAEHLVRALRHRQVDVEALYLADEGHELTLPASIASFAAAAGAHFRRRLDAG